jgi:hypothetical protein
MGYGMIAPAVMLRALEILEGTSKNGHRSAGTPDLPTNGSVLFSVPFCTVHPKDAGDCRLLQFFEVPLDRFAQTHSLWRMLGAAHWLNIHAPVSDIQGIIGLLLAGGATWGAVAPPPQMASAQ